DGRPELIGWSSQGVAIYKSGTAELVPYGDSGLEAIRNVIDVAPGDYTSADLSPGNFKTNDGLVDVCILTGTEAALFVNVKGRFQRDPTVLPPGSYSKAIWVNYDHDNDLDLLLFGERPVLLQNTGRSGFIDKTSEFPFVKGDPTDAILF